MAQLKGPSTLKRPRKEEAEAFSDSDDDDILRFYKWNCNQIRTKINALLHSGEMKVTEFQRTNDINGNSHERFMKLKGSYGGIDNQTYHQGHKFFIKREKMGIKMPRAKTMKPEDLAKYDVSGI